MVDGHGGKGQVEEEGRGRGGNEEEKFVIAALGCQVNTMENREPQL